MKPLWKFMWLAMQDKTMILLTVAALVSLAFGLYSDFSPSHPPDEPRVHWIEGCAILVAVLIVMLASSINDYQKERQFQKLNAKKDSREVKVFRNGEMQLISIYDVVVGDIMNLEPGDVISADGVLVEASNLKADESAATGESDTIKKNFIKDPFILSGSKITEGVGKYVVCAVGIHSFFGKTMMALRTESTMTPLQVKLDALAEKIAKLGATAALLMFLVLFGKYLGVVLTGEGFGPDCAQSECTQEAIQRFINIVISAITVIVVAVPEGLPLAVTLALAYATTQMLKDNNLVRVLSSCEVMGGYVFLHGD
jgi:Ca2+-transporting ATPase